MKTKHQICLEADIPMTTLNYWINQRVMPAPTGINKQAATWEDDIMQTVEFIKTNQAAGMALDAIKAALPGFYLEQSDKAQAKAAFLAEWLDVDKAREELRDLFDCDLTGADIMLSHTARCWLTVIDGQTVTLAEVERINRLIVKFHVLTLKDYLAIVTAEIRAKAGKGIVHTEHVNLAHKVFANGLDVKAMAETAHELIKASAKLHN